ncbi:YqzH family protein [Bacillus sp. 03113]|uniref:YqzH family protein n=1 Tax=Bacillus sp. 03113 TaxID=2578211 RepID=UPI001141B294|nr:YqzH family protein [Bacillus sp. 03113]
MDKKFIFKMMKSCLKQYLPEDVSLTDEDFESMYEKVVRGKKTDESAVLHDLVQDVVYEYITNSPYF